MKYPKHYTSGNYLKKVRLHDEPYFAEIAEHKIIIYPNVMSPKYDRSAQMMISMMPNQKGKTILEIGSGTGILSLSALSQGANNVFAVDINSHAVKNTEKNLTMYKNKKVLHSDLFESVTGTFDTIIFNAPFHGNKADDVLELGTSDFNYETLTRFMSEAKKYLNKYGEIQLGFADMGDNDLLKNLIEKNGYVVKKFQTYPNGDWTMYLYTLSYAQDAST